MRTLTLVLAAAAAAALSIQAGAASAAVPSYVAAAVADPGRPAADTARDADRKPADVLTFSGLKPGDKVGEFIPGGGYYTRLISKVVGASGHDYALWPAGMMSSPRMQAMVAATTSIGPNVSNVGFGATLSVPEQLDVVWTSENYHDFHNAFPPGSPAPDMAAFNKAVYNALKPGGVFLIEDHAAAPGAGPGVTSTLHRIDPAQVKTEVEAAGFKLAAESDVLKNPADTHELKVQDPAIRWHTDKMLFRFVKPAG